MKRLRGTRSMSAICRKGAALGAVAALIAPAVSAASPQRDPVVNFRSNALFTCFGAAGGTPTANTANITASPFTVTARVTVRAPAGTTVFGDLTQDGCVRLKFFSFTVPASGVATFTVSDLRISNTAFVFFTNTLGQFQVTPDVNL